MWSPYKGTTNHFENASQALRESTLTATSFVGRHNQRKTVHNGYKEKVTKTKWLPFVTTSRYQEIIVTPMAHNSTDQRVGEKRSLESHLQDESRTSKRLKAAGHIPDSSSGERAAAGDDQGKQPPSSSAVFHCFFASELAAAIDKNPYQSPTKVVERLWKVYDTEGWSRGHAAAEKKTSEHAVSHFEKKQEGQALWTELRKLVESGDVNQADMLLRKTMEREKELEIKGEQGGLMSDLKAEEKQMVAKELHNRIAQVYGQQNESKALDLHGQQVGSKVEGNNDKFYKKRCFRLTWQNDDEEKTDEGISYGSLADQGKKEHHIFYLGGKIDGKYRKLNDEEHLVEVKSRKNRLFDKVPEYELVQMHAYMWLLGKSECECVQYLPSTQERRVTIVPWDDNFWAMVQTRLKKFSMVFMGLTQGSARQQREYFEKSEEERSEMLKQMIEL